MLIMKKGNDPSPTIHRILEEFRDKYEGANWEAVSSKSMNDMIAFLTDKLQEVERESKIEALEWLQNNASGGGSWRRQIIMKLSHLKSGEEIINKPFNKEKFIKDAREVKKTFKEEKTE